MNALDDFPQLFEFEIFCDLVETDVLQRLSNVSFLGAVALLGPIDRRRHPHAGGSRFQHTIGVAYLAYLATIHLSRKEQEVAIAAALLHDIGHGPLSHSTEGFFRRRFSIDHKTEGRRLLLEDTEIRKILRRHKIETYRIERLAFGKQKDALSFLFHFPINIDTIEGITRCAETFGVSDSNPSQNDLVSLLVEPDQIAQDAGDKFWRLKDSVYNHYILSPLGVVSDITCQLALERATTVSKADFYLDDNAFLSKFTRSMDEVVAGISASAERKQLPFEILQSMCRKFGINQDFEVRRLEDLPSRYR